jgi:hypothetical protein
MAYLIQPPAQSADACNLLFTYSVEDPTRSEMAMILDFQDWGWQVSLHLPNDPVFLEAMDELEKAIKKRRQQTQSVYGNVGNNAPRLTLEETWEGEAKRRLTAGLYDRVYQVEAKREVVKLEVRREEHLGTVPEEQHVPHVAEVKHIPWPGFEEDETQEIDNNVSEDESDQQVND